MIKFNSHNNITKEYGYNKITIIVSILITILCYFTWQKSIGIITWFAFLAITFLIAGISIIPGWHILVSIPLSFFFIVGTIYIFLTRNFTDVIFLNIEADNIIFDWVLTIKDKILPYSELGSIYTGIIFLFIFWAHPNPNGEKYNAYDPRKIIEYTKNNPFEARFFFIQLIIATLVALIGGKLLTTAFTWFIFYILIKKSIYENLQRNNQTQRFWHCFIIYCLIFVSYTLFGTDKSPLDALIGIITMNP